MPDMTAQQKVTAYYKEMKQIRDMVALGTVWEKIEPKFNDLHHRLEQENNDVQYEVALKGQELAEFAIKIYGAMPKFVFNVAASKLKKSMPTDLTATKRSMDSVEASLGSQMTARVAFYYNAVRQLPDNDPGNPEAMLQAMRQAYHIK